MFMFDFAFISQASKRLLTASDTVENSVVSLILHRTKFRIDVKGKFSYASETFVL